MYDKCVIQKYKIPKKKTVLIISESGGSQIILLNC